MILIFAPTRHLVGPPLLQRHLTLESLLFDNDLARVGTPDLKPIFQFYSPSAGNASYGSQGEDEPHVGGKN